MGAPISNSVWSCWSVSHSGAMCSSHCTSRGPLSGVPTSLPLAAHAPGDDSLRVGVAPPALPSTARPQPGGRGDDSAGALGARPPPLFRLAPGGGVRDWALAAMAAAQCFDPLALPVEPAEPGDSVRSRLLGRAAPASADPKNDGDVAAADAAEASALNDGAGETGKGSDLKPPGETGKGLRSVLAYALTSSRIFSRRSWADSSPLSASKSKSNSVHVGSSEESWYVFR